MNIVLIGYGKMGRAIEQIAVEKGHTIGMKISTENADDLTPDKLKEHDVAIEFTTPASAVNNILTCFEAGIPVVSGTTGWLENFDQVAQHCKKKNGGLLYASNFSIGVNIFFEINKALASLMKDHPEYEARITEIHHTQKKDAPSGTAITIAEQILQHITSKEKWVNNKPASPTELLITSERKDPAPGTHMVKYSSAVDDIEIIHTAHNRTGFASGAVLAAEFMMGKKGIFGMKEVLGL